MSVQSSIEVHSAVLCFMCMPIIWFYSSNCYSTVVLCCTFDVSAYHPPQVYLYEKRLRLLLWRYQMSTNALISNSNEFVTSIYSITLLLIVVNFLNRMAALRILMQFPHQVLQ